MSSVRTDIRALHYALRSRVTVEAGVGEMVEWSCCVEGVSKSFTPLFRRGELVLPIPSVALWMGWMVVGDTYVEGGEVSVDVVVKKKWPNHLNKRRPVKSLPVNLLLVSHAADLYCLLNTRQSIDSMCRTQAARVREELFRASVRQRQLERQRHRCRK
jgi:hypothetical protein